MKGFWTIFKKEIYRVFKEPRLWLALILPGILIYVVYTVIGGAVAKAADPNPDFEYKVAVAGMPQAQIEEFDETVLNAEPFSLNAKYEVLETADELNAAKERLKSGEIHIVLEFESGSDFFDNASNKVAQSVIIYYNSSVNTSSLAYANVSGAIELFKIDNQLDLLTTLPQLVVDAEKANATLLSSIIPMLLMAFLFSGCMSVAPESIAGEKERGTMATMLITPVKRSSIALGKIAALSVLSIISALSSFIGLIFSLPSLLGAGAVASISFGQYALMFLVLISTVLLIVSVMAIISSFSKSVKEANMFIMPFMIISLVIGLSAMLTGGAVTGIGFYFIPLFNTSQSLVSILTSSISIWNLVVTVLTNLAFTGLCVFLLTRIFNSERIMYSV